MEISKEADPSLRVNYISVEQSSIYSKEIFFLVRLYGDGEKGE